MPSLRYWPKTRVQWTDTNDTDRPASTALDGRDVIVDAPERDPITSQLESIGPSRDRELVRMTYPDADPALLTDDVRAFVDFAFG